MGRLTGQKPLSGPADRWDRWMDVMELNWYSAMEAARGEYAGIRDAVQSRALNGSPSRVDSKETRPGDE